MRDKRGMSTIVANLVIILLVIVAIGIVWVVINNVIKGGTEGVSLNKINVGLKLSNVELGPNEVTVTVERTSGSGNMSGISFVVSNGTYSEVFEVDSSLDSLQQGTYTLQSVNVTNIETIEAYPIILSNSGEEVVSENKFEYEVSYDEVLISGLVSWWRFDGDTTDEFGSNDGTLTGDATFASGRFNEALSLDGDDDAVQIPAFGFVSEDSVLTYSFWYNGENTSLIQTFFGSGTTGQCTSGEGMNYIYRHYNGYFYVRYCNGTTLRADLNYNGLLTNYDNEWVHVVIVLDYLGGTMDIYLNGEHFFSDTATYNMVFDDEITTKYIGGYSSTVNNLYGYLDEFMIFNKTLDEEEVEALYRFNLDKISFV